jgi:tripartite-type tricarboxylate transporter receptor subunit TctC
LSPFPARRATSARAATRSASTLRLSREINEALKLPEVRERLAGAGLEPAGTSREEFARIIAADAERWRQTDPRGTHYRRLALE